MKQTASGWLLVPYGIRSRDNFFRLQMVTNQFQLLLIINFEKWKIFTFPVITTSKKVPDLSDYSYNSFPLSTNISVFIRSSLLVQPELVSHLQDPAFPLLYQMAFDEVNIKHPLEMSVVSKLHQISSYQVNNSIYKLCKAAILTVTLKYRILALFHDAISYYGHKLLWFEF